MYLLRNTLLGTALLALSVNSMAVDKKFSKDEVTQIQNIVHDYLLDNPEVLVEVSQKLQKKQQDETINKTSAAIAKNVDVLLKGDWTVAGPAKGDVTIVEFFDYQCVHCKHMAVTLNAVEKKDSNLRIVYKEFPIFGKISDSMSRAAIAAAKQGKYAAAQEILFKLEKPSKDEEIIVALKPLNLNMDQLQKDMLAQDVTDMLAANKQLAADLSLMGTPALVFIATPNGSFKAGSQPKFIPGGASDETMKKYIAELRKS
jgi:protein-disulfide isomerase